MRYTAEYFGHELLSGGSIASVSTEASKIYFQWSLTIDHETQTISVRYSGSRDGAHLTTNVLDPGLPASSCYSLLLYVLALHIVVHASQTASSCRQTPVRKLYAMTKCSICSDRTIQLARAPPLIINQ